MTKGDRTAGFAFGKKFAVFQKAKSAWKKYRLAWCRQKSVSTAAWGALLKEIGKYKERVKAPSARERIKQRWDTVSYTRAKTTVSLSGRVHLVTVCRHRGLDLNVQNGIADITLCHRNARMSAKVGDLIVGITAVALKGEATSDGPRSRWPPVYHAAINDAWPRRRVVWIAAVSSIHDEFAFHADLPYGIRNTAVYKRTRQGERKLQHRRTRKYNDLPKPGRNGPSVVSNSYVRYPSDLQDAPYVPKKHIAMYRRISLGRDRICPAGDAHYYIKLFQSIPAGRK